MYKGKFYSQSPISLLWVVGYGGRVRWEALDEMLGRFPEGGVGGKWN
jgi:hypothetical protein